VSLPRSIEGAVNGVLIFSCEHAGNDIPSRYARYFADSAAKEALQSHRGWDPGSAELGAHLARDLAAPLILQRVSRLLVECNRSEGHPRLFSEWAASMSEREREEVVEGYWRPHRAGVRAMVQNAPIGRTVVHVGVHTFTPVWNGRRRSTDIGLLYDPRRAPEAFVARRWKTHLARALAPEGLKVHLNRPYRGWTDALTTTLRREFPATRYVGLELEVSQGIIPLSHGALRALSSSLSAAVG